MTPSYKPLDSMPMGSCWATLSHQSEACLLPTTPVPPRFAHDFTDEALRDPAQPLDSVLCGFLFKSVFKNVFFLIKRGTCDTLLSRTPRVFIAVMFPLGF